MNRPKYPKLHMCIVSACMSEFDWRLPRNYVTRDPRSWRKKIDDVSDSSERNRSYLNLRCKRAIFSADVEVVRCSLCASLEIA
jgi:hypothetical protein